MDSINKVFKNITFIDDKGIIYTPYTSLDKIYLGDDLKFDNIIIKIGNKSFSYKDYSECFFKHKENCYVNITSLLGFVNPLSNPHILNIEVITNDKSYFIYNLYLCNFSFEKMTGDNLYDERLIINNVKMDLNSSQLKNYSFKMTIDDKIINISF